MTARKPDPRAKQSSRRREADYPDEEDIRHAVRSVALHEADEALWIDGLQPFDPHKGESSTA